jgi:hypothetical protein
VHSSEIKSPKRFDFRWGFNTCGRYRIRTYDLRPVKAAL